MDDKVKMISQQLQRARQTKEPIDFIRHYYTLTESEAYRVQDEFIERTDEHVSGYKISMTSPDTQALANTNEPAYGTFTERHIASSGNTVSLSSLFEPLLEPELIFVLTEDLSRGADEDEILRKSKIAAGVEIPDSCYKDWFPNFSLTDLLCDNAAAGLVVMSEAVNPPALTDLANVQMTLYYNGKPAGEGMSSHVMGNPASAVSWLAGKLAEHGKSLTKGMVIASGTFISPLRVEAGTYHASYTGIGDVRVTFQ